MKDERSTIERALTGDEAALRELVETNQNAVYSMIFRQVRDHDIAEELVQETFIRAHRRLESFEFRSSFATWLIRIALNVTLNYLKSRPAASKKVTVPYEDSVHDRENQSNLEELVAREQRFVALKECMAKLTDKYKDVVTLCSFEACSYQRAAEILEIPVGTIASRMNTAFRLLRECISKRTAHEK